MTRMEQLAKGLDNALRELAEYIERRGLTVIDKSYQFPPPVDDQDEARRVLMSVVVEDKGNRWMTFADVYLPMGTSLEDLEGITDEIWAIYCGYIPFTLSHRIKADVRAYARLRSA